MSAAHTSGPWGALVVGKPAANGKTVQQWYVSQDEGPEIVCWLPERETFSVRDRQTARLIAAAPDLLQALRDLYAVAPAKPPGAGLIVGIESKHAAAVAAARAAIAKATGGAA